MEKNNFFNVRQIFKITLVLTFLSFGVFAQNNQTSGTLASVSDKNTEKTVIERPRVVDNKAEKSVENNVKAVRFSGEMEQKVFKMLNNIRVEKGLAPLIWNNDLAKVARIHSENMAKLNFFSHTGKDGFMVNDRADSLGLFNWQALGENIAYNRGYDDPAEKACDSWMKSPGHRDNILNKVWKEAALGIAITADGTVYFTHVFMLK